MELSPDAPVADLLETHLAAGLEAEVEGRGAVLAEGAVVRAQRRAPALAGDDLRLRVGEELEQRLLPRERRHRHLPRAAHVEVLLELHPGPPAGSAASSRRAELIELADPQEEGRERQRLIGRPGGDEGL